MQLKLTFAVLFVYNLLNPIFPAEDMLKVSTDVSVAEKVTENEDAKPEEETGADDHKVRNWNLPAKQTDSFGNEFVLIPEGTFMLDGEKEANKYPFYMATMEVTQELWVKVMGAKTWEKSEAYLGYPFVYTPENPVIMVSFEEIYIFITKLNAALDQPLYRLPTTAEWTYAALAGTNTKFSFGDDPKLLTEYAWYEGNSDDLMPAGSLKPNPWGLYDMHGSVWELTVPVGFDFAKPMTKLEGDMLEDRDKLGGSWMNPQEDCYSTSKGTTSVVERGEDLGFRLVLDAPLIKKIRDRGL